MNNRSQAVRIPKESQFTTSEVYASKQGDEVTQSADSQEWSTYLATTPAASQSFLEDIDDLPVQEREP